jgi:hypothetical protein
VADYEGGEYKCCLKDHSDKDNGGRIQKSRLPAPVVGNLSSSEAPRKQPACKVLTMLALRFASQRR